MKVENFNVEVHNINGKFWIEFSNDAHSYVLTLVSINDNLMSACFDNFNLESFVISPFIYSVNDVLNKLTICDFLDKLYNSNILKGCFRNYNFSNDNLLEEVFDDKLIDEYTFSTLSKGLDYFYDLNLIR